MLTFQCNDKANMIQAKSMIKNINEKKGIFIKVSVKANEVCHRLQSIPDLGPMVASAYVNEWAMTVLIIKGMMYQHR